MLGTLFSPWRSSRLWWSLGHISLELPIGLATFIPTITLLALAIGLIPLLPAAVAVATVLFLGIHQLARLERSRFAALLACPLTDQSEPLTGSLWRRFSTMVRSRARWKEVAYFLVTYPRSVITSTVVVAAWGGGVALLTLPAFVSQLPGHTAKFGLFTVRSGGPAVAVAAAGLVVVALVAPWLTVGVANLDRAIARALLGRPERVELEERVAELQTSRTRAVDSAEAERRRIERDLHDGAQQRLIAVAMDLGRARSEMDVAPERAAELVAGAHDEIKAAIKELRDLVRGFHPVILEDRGLDAALSAVVARSPVPVSLQVDVSPRPSPAVESAAYFIVSEALVNVARHAAATHAAVEIARHGDRLTIVVTDDGRGGADPANGTGLAGLADRVAALDGRLQLISPLGGPTTLIAEVACS